MSEVLPCFERPAFALLQFQTLLYLWEYIMLGACGMVGADFVNSDVQVLMSFYRRLSFRGDSPITLRSIGALPVLSMI